jgi:predicted ATPase
MRQYTAQLFRGDKSSGREGTAWLCSSNYAITAAHCVGDITKETLWPDPFSLHFMIIDDSEQVKRDATVIQVDWKLDIALLHVQSGISVEPGQVEFWKLPRRAGESSTQRWSAWGFPRAQGEGLLLSGTISALRAPYKRIGAIQLLCEHGGFDELRGASGAALMHELTGAVVGVITGSVLENLVLYAQPLERIREEIPWIDDVLSGRIPAGAGLPELRDPIGRQDDIDKITRMVEKDKVRALTLTGPHGVGKTLLGVRAAKGLHLHFPGGIYYVDLRSLTSPGESPQRPDRQEIIVAQKLAEKLAPQQAADRDSIAAALRAKKVLLIFDNFEDLRAAGSLVAFLLKECPRLQVLITSRVLLGGEMRAYEQEFKVSKLTSPKAGIEDLSTLNRIASVELFVEQAKHAKPNFELTADNADAVAQICRYLDGLPLAIRVVAAQVKTVEPAQLLEQWKETILDRAFAYSYNRLKEPEAKTFRLLSVFAGGCRKDHAAVFCEKIPGFEKALQSLVHKNLLETVKESGRKPRYRMLPTIREYAYQQLRSENEAEAASERYQKLYLDLVESVAPKLASPQREPCMEILRAEEDNIRATLRSTLGASQEPETALRIAGSLFWFWNFSGNFAEGITWLEEACRRGGSKYDAPRARALYALAGLYFMQGDYAQARPLIEESVRIWELLKAKSPLGYALIILGMVDLFLKPGPSSALKHQKRSRELMTADNDAWGWALATNDLARAVLHDKGHEKAYVLFDESLKAWKGLGDKWGIALTLTAWGEAAKVHQPEEALKKLNLALQIQTDRNDRWGEAVTLAVMGEILVMQEDFAGAEAQFRRSLQLHQNLGRKELIADCLEGLALVATGLHDPARAAFLFGATEALRNSTKVQMKDKHKAHKRYVKKAQQEAVKRGMSLDEFERRRSLGNAEKLESVCNDILAPAQAALPAKAEN